MIISNELRQKYLDFFKSKAHAIIPSASLIPENDPTTLFTSAGMQPMIPHLLGEPHAQGTRIVNSQKCFRTQDIDEVGDNRHTTFFEMLGNWSLGDYFKKEQIEWMWEFLIKKLNFDPNKIFITCFRGDVKNNIPRDEEAAKIWQELFKSVGVKAEIVNNSEKDGMKGGRIFYYAADKNWWSRAGVPEKMPEGEPGGPDSEMFFDFSPSTSSWQAHHDEQKYGKHCHVNCDCGRFVEIGNNVFMQYVKTKNGFNELKQKNIDFGGGLERMTAALNNNPDIFRIDLFSGALKKIEELSGKTYGADEKETFAFRVILDHLRAAVFLIADGAVPSRKDQGYFTRRLIRRAVRFAANLGISQLFTPVIAKEYIETYKNVYADLFSQQNLILSELEKEESKFRETLERGIMNYELGIKGLAAKVIPGDVAFDLYQSYGFPIEMTIELAKEKGIDVDVAGFNEEMKKHQEVSRIGAEQKFKGGLAGTGEMETKYHTATHLLLAALNRVLDGSSAIRQAHGGESYRTASSERGGIFQKGSNITVERLRFDFNYPEKLTVEQIKSVEDLVNEKIKEDKKVEMLEMPRDEALKTVKVSFDPSKYPEIVKVYKIGDFSMELCGGPHVEHTGALGQFKIVKEEASSAGVRRIKAILL
ncbi:MAG: alanine--tRNA ligase [Candidatus Magasanikbacteria bacterium]|nr:alanine--tRNA ligase [Candidatus Magasanikbacteria bacterium]